MKKKVICLICLIITSCAIENGQLKTKQEVKDKIGSTRDGLIEKAGGKESLFGKGLHKVFVEDWEKAQNGTLDKCNMNAISCSMEKHLKKRIGSK